METDTLDSHERIEKLLTENQALLIENNTILKKQEKRAVRSFWLRVVWFAILIGLPIILLPYIMATVMGSMGLPAGDSSSSMSETLKNAEETLRLLQNR